MIYAQINADGICYAVTQAAGPVDAPDMIERPVFDESELLQRWDALTSTFESVAENG